MKISELINELNAIKVRHGDIEVTCTASLLPDGYGGIIPDVFESTVEHLVVLNKPSGGLTQRVRLYL